jgi:hypothetical protein
MSVPAAAAVTDQVSPVSPNRLDGARSTAATATAIAPGSPASEKRIGDENDKDVEAGAGAALQKRQTELVDQTSRFPLRQLLTIFACLQMLLFISFVDQSSVAAILPVLAADLGAGDVINWVGTSWLIATASTQMVLPFDPVLRWRWRLIVRVRRSSLASATSLGGRA